MIWNKVVTGRLFIFYREKYNAVKYVESLEIKGWLISEVPPFTTAFNNITVDSNCLSAMDYMRHGDIMFTRK